MVAKWKTAGLVFLLALTMSTAVLAAGGIGVSELARPVSQVPPAPDVSPFRVVAGVPVTDDPFANVPAPVVAPREVRAQEAASAIEADETAVTTARGRQAAAVPAPVPPAVRPAPAPAPGRQAAPRPAPSGGGERPAEPRPEPPVKEAPEQGETAQPDAAPEDDDERLRAAGDDDDRNRNNGNAQPKPQDHKHRAPESRQASSNGNAQGSQGQPEGQSQPQSAGAGESGGQPGGSQKH